MGDNGGDNGNDNDDNYEVVMIIPLYELWKMDKRLVKYNKI